MYTKTNQMNKPNLNHEKFEIQTTKSFAPHIE